MTFNWQFHKASGPLATWRSLTWLIILCALLASCGKSGRSPNIILIMSDDQGWYDARFNGNDVIKTPYLDQLASEGLIFDRFYAASPVCSPTRASALTGRNPYRIEIPHANTGHMKVQEITLPELLREQGYVTGHFGKWHLGTFTTRRKDANRGGRPEHDTHFSPPTMHGYDEYFATESKVPTYDPMQYPQQFGEGESRRFGWRAIINTDSAQPYGTAYWTHTGEPESENLSGDDSRIIVDRAIPFIRRAVKSKKPFFTTIWLHTPHLPVVSPEKFRQLYAGFTLDKQLYYGAITAMDEQIGRVWNELENLGIDQETILFFCSDNGPENGTPGSSGQFRERKRSLHEGGIRVPAFVTWKNQITPGGRIKFPAITSDYLPTILDILGVPYPANRPLDGLSLLPAMKGTKERREQPIGFLFGNQVAWMNNQYKLIRKEEGKFELYDLQEDPSEITNLSDDEPEILQTMISELETWKEEVSMSALGDDYK